MAYSPRKTKDRPADVTRDREVARGAGRVIHARRDREAENARPAALVESDRSVVVSQDRDREAAATNAESAQQADVGSELCNSSLEAFRTCHYLLLTGHAVAARIEDTAEEIDPVRDTSEPAAIALGNCKLRLKHNHKQTKIQFRNFALEAATAAQSPEIAQDPVIAAKEKERNLIARRRRSASIHSHARAQSHR